MPAVPMPMPRAPTPSPCQEYRRTSSGYCAYEADAQRTATDRAQAAYQKLLDEYPESQYVPTARRELQDLGH